MRSISGLAALATGLAILIFLALAGSAGGLRINLSVSAPIGLWRLEAVQLPLKIGQRVFVCLADHPWVEEALARGYLRYGTCPNRTAPLIKTIVGLSGQTVQTSLKVVLDGTTLTGSGIRHWDGAGRRLPRYGGGTIPQGQVYIHSTEPSSFDSRYFGPVPASAVVGLAVPVLTWVDQDNSH